VCAAAEAMVELLGRANRKRGRFLFVERAAGFVLVAPLFERYAAVDNVYDISTREDVIDKGVGYAAWHGRILAVNR